jgi:ectoine hydroxylase-related dioxygenase (phytanoyl-CoA dioxygenase family)
MADLNVSFDTAEFEVHAALDSRGRLTHDCASQAQVILDTHGFVLIRDLLSDEEAADGLALVRQVIDNPDRETGAFASETDIRHRRRDFCPLPSTAPVLDYSHMLCHRLEEVLLEYCGRSRQVIEISTLTSYRGSSHQYIHRDPEGVLCMFVAVDDVSPEQGGTVFVPGTHPYNGSEDAHDGKANMLMRLFQAQANFRILRYNLANLWRVRKSVEPPITWRELRARVFSLRTDLHQPNLARFFIGGSAFTILNFTPLNILNFFCYRKLLKKAYRLVQAAPKKGSVMLYRSDMLHAGPDNRSPKPRYFFNLNIARDLVLMERWQHGYSPHPTLLAHPVSLGGLLERTCDKD